MANLSLRKVRSALMRDSYGLFISGKSSEFSSILTVRPTELSLRRLPDRVIVISDHICHPHDKGL